ncbi:MAG: protein translocase subunit SecF [Treponema sp.]|nr:protein translocase subunit SecF [Spirochaetia bacterium]MDD7581006.1 protein translocase subunit SecF [Treponema sp.]MDY5838960.1 protein translocase subunit SecF [Treponema sp.]
MKTVKKFSKAFPVCAVISFLIIAAGVAGYFIKGINYGIDFVPGLVDEVRIAPPAISVTYSGTATASIEASNLALDVIISGAGAENETKSFTFGQNPTVGDMVKALNSVEGINAVLLSGESSDSYGLYLDSASTSRLYSDSALKLYVAKEDPSVNIDTVRASLSSQNVVVKELGVDGNKSFQIRAAISDDSVSVEKLQDGIMTSLHDKFGSDNVAIVKTDFVGSQFSNSLAYKSIALALVTLLIIWGYATIRFHWDFALGSIIALVHDCLIMFTFISWSQIEFSTTTFAAVLTIFGYSINATVVILDRVRENIRVVQTKDFRDILDTAITGTLSRSIITTVTTLFASISLLVFTTGSIRDFAVVLTVGLISGCYSSIFISGGVIALARRHWEPGVHANHVRPHENKNVISMPAN